MTRGNVCPLCLKSNRFFYQGICLRCHVAQLVMKRLDEMKTEIQPACEYNGLIFDLYLSYIRRCKLHASHRDQAVKLMEILERDKIPVITSWADIDRLSKKYQLWDLPGKTGCAFKKIGRMLHGLGVLDVSWEEGTEGRRQRKVLDQLSPETAIAVKSFIKMLQKNKRSPSTVSIFLTTILYLELWLKTIDPNHGVMLACAVDIESYFDHLRREKCSANRIYNCHGVIKRFYRWACLEKRLLVDPARLISINKPSKSIEICSEADLDILVSFIKNSKSDPADAFLLSLVLYFGFSIRQLCLAQLAPGNGDTLRILLAAREPTCCMHFKRPADHLDLPSNPEWFLRLQKRYESHWRARYADINKISVRRPLFLPEKKWYNAPLQPTTLYQRLKRATSTALGGRSIPWGVLHSSCGVLHTRYQDASILTKLGWSPQHACSYVYIQKKIYSPSISK